MQPSLPPEFGPWLAMFLVLAVGVATIVGSAALLCRPIRSAAWQRTVWQVSFVAVLALLLVEWTGTGRGLVHSCATDLCVMDSCATDSCATAVPACATAVSAVPDTGHPFSETLQPTTPGNDFRTAETAVAHVTPTPRTAETAVAHVPSTPRTPETAVAHGTIQAPPSNVWWPAALWALGTAVILGRMLWAGLLLRAFRRRAGPCDETVQRRVTALARRLGLRRPVRVLAADGLRVPVAFGILRPTLALPAAFDAEFDPPQQEAMLAHEVAHLAAGDPGWHLLASCACALLWWHPLIWWSRRRLRAASETAADEFSLVVHNGPSVLAECLVALGRRMVRPPRLSWLSVEGNGFRSGLGRRVERLLKLRARPWQAPGRGRMLCAKCVLPVLLVLAAISCTAWAQPQVPLSEGGETMNVLRSSWRCSLAATALWAMLGPAQVNAAEDEGPRDKPRAGADAERPRDAKPADREPRRERKEGEAREGERRDRPSPEAQMQQRQKLEEAARDLKARLEKLGPDQEAEAKTIKQKLERVMNELRGMQEPRREGANPEVMQRLEQMKRRIAELKEAGKNDEAERVASEARDMMKRLQGGREGAPGDRPRPNAEAEQRLEQMKRRIAELKAAGKNDEAERVAREASDMMQRLRGGREGAREGAPGDRPRPNAEAEQRLEQMKRRVAELREAGKNEEAERVAREASDMMQRLRGAREGAAGDRPRPGAQDQTIQELRNELQQMHREMQEMREMMKKLLERERK